MKTNPFRFVLAITAGVVLAYFMSISLQSFIPKLFNLKPLPEYPSIEQLNEFINTFPFWAQFLNCLALFIGAFIGGYVAARITQQRKQQSALGVGLFLSVVLVFVLILFLLLFGRLYLF